MPTPFPGMDPYLERPDLWPDVHNRLVVLLADDLAPRLRPRYYVSIEERTYSVGMGELVFAGRGDVAVFGPSSLEPQQVEDIATGPELVLVELPVPDEIRETYLEVRSVATDRVITLLEILSPTNKRGGEGREMYLRKRLHVAGTLTHLVDIDLLRSGEPMPMRGDFHQRDYRLRSVVSKGGRKPNYYLLASANPFQGSNCPFNLVTKSLKSTSTVCFTNCMIALVTICVSTIAISQILLSKATTGIGLLSYYTRLAFDS